MTSYVEMEKEEAFDFDPEEVFRQVMEEALELEQCPYEAQACLLLTDDAGIREYNRTYRQIDASTDVLSFPMLTYLQAGDFSAAEEAEADCFDPESGELLLGDIVLSTDRIREQAARYGHSEKREFAFLIAHSMLHLCGYDHMEPEEAAVMEKKQEQILEKLGITRE